MALVKILLFFVLFWYGAKLLLRWLLPAFILSQKQRKETSKEEGDVTIIHNTKKQQQDKESRKKGEYVDYEEVK